MKISASRLVLIAALVLLFAGTGLSAVGSASTTYEVSVPDPIDVPDRVVEAGGQELSITSIARVEPGESIEASTTAPENESYLLLQYNSTGSITNFAPLEGSSSATFSTDEIDPGTYLLVLDGDNGRATQPVVVAGYDAVLTIPDEAKPGEMVNATVELDSISDDDPAIDSVELVVMDGDEPERIEANANDTSGDTFVYEAELTVPDEEGEYEVFSTVFGEESIANSSEQEVLEITETSIEVSEGAAEDDSGGNETNTSDPDNGNETDGDNPGDGESGGGGGTPVDDGGSETDEGSVNTPGEVLQQAQATMEADAETGGARAAFDEGSPVEQVTFESDVKGTVEVTTWEPESVNVEPSSRTAVLVSEVTVPEDARDSPATVRMTIEAARLEEHDATAEELRVERLSDGTWESLETTVVEEGSNRVVLEAETPGFSTFAVTAEDDADDGESTNTDGEDGSTGTDNGGSTGGDGDDGSDEADSEVTDDSTPGFGVLATLVALTMLAAAAVTRTRRSD